MPFSSVRYLFLGSMPFLDVIRRSQVPGSSKMLLIPRIRALSCLVTEESRIRSKDASTEEQEAKISSGI